MQPLTQMPQQLAQTAQQLMQSGMGAFGKGGTGGLGEADPHGGRSRRRIRRRSGPGDVGAGGGSGAVRAGAGGGGIGTTPWRCSARRPPPAATTTAPTAGRCWTTCCRGHHRSSADRDGRNGRHADDAPRDAWRGAGGKEDKAATKRVSAPVVKNGAPIQGRITAPPTPVVTKTVDGEKKPTTRRIVIPGKAEKADD